MSDSATHTHTFERPDIGVVSVVRLWRLTDGGEVKFVPLVHLDKLLDVMVWENEANDPNCTVTPRQVLASPEQFPSHWARITQIDEHPILVLWPDGISWPTDVVDGMHRLARASHDRRDGINVRVVTRDVLHAARIDDDTTDAQSVN